MTDQEILKHIKEMLTDIANSTWWNELDSPISASIIDLYDRIDSTGDLKKFREHKDYEFLCKIAECFEVAFNDDWLAFEIIDLELSYAREFLTELLSIFDIIDTGHWDTTIRELYQKIADKQKENNKPLKKVGRWLKKRITP